MAGLVTVQPGGKRFSVDGNESILEAALRAGLALGYGCSNGNCGLCVAQVISGCTEKIKSHDFVINEAGKEQGQLLLCSYTVRNDVEIRASEARDASDIPLQHIDARLKKLLRLAGDTWLLHLQTPRTRRLRFLAGQSALLSVADVELNLPIASCPCDDRNIEFHLQLPPGTPWRDDMMVLKTGDRVCIDGPTGEFHLQDESQRPRLFIAVETGFAPVKSLVEHAMQLEQPQQHFLYWFVGNEGSHYMNNQMRSWADAFDNFHYAARTSDINGVPQLAPLLEHLARQEISLTDCDIYVAGPWKEIEQVRRAVLTAGCRVDRVSVNVVS